MGAPTGPRRFYVLTALVVVTASLVTLALLTPVFGARADFSIYNTRWNGASDLARDVYGTGDLVPTFGVSLGGDDVTLVHRSFAEYDTAPRSSSLLLLGPAKPPTEAEAEWLRAFVHEGGRLVLASDFGAGNAYLEALGAESRFDGGLLLDLAFTKKPEFVVSTNPAPHPVTEGVEEVVLDYATALRPGANATVLAQTGVSAWIDRDGDHEKDANEVAGPLPWLSVEPYGKGDILILGDPSLVINGMRPLADNDAFAANLAAWLTEDGRATLIDESHHDYPDPVRVMGFVLRDLPDAWRLALAAGAFAAFVAFAALPSPRRALTRPLTGVRRLLDRIFPPPPEPQVDLVAKVRKRHPDWDESQLTQILTDWENRA